jgi:hypothetical protein
MFAEPTPSTRAAETDTMSTEPRSESAPRTEARDAHTGPVPVMPPAQVSPNCTHPARLARATEVALARRCRATSRPPALAVDPVKRPAAPFSTHTFMRDARLTVPSARSPRSPSEDCALDRIRRPKTALPSGAELIRTSPICSATPIHQLATAYHSTEASRYRCAGTHRLTVATRARAPKGSDSRTSPDRSRVMRPASVELNCKQRSPTSAGQTSRDEHTYACSRVRTRTRRLSSACTARTRTHDRQARTSRPKTPS